MSYLGDLLCFFQVIFTFLYGLLGLPALGDINLSSNKSYWISVFTWDYRKRSVNPIYPDRSQGVIIQAPDNDRRSKDYDIQERHEDTVR